MNPFYCYSLTWIIVLIFYLIPLSAFSGKISLPLMVFLFFTITVSSFLGYKYRKRFQFILLDNCCISTWPVILIVVGYLYEFYKFGSIPFLSIVAGSARYGDYLGEKGLHVLLTMSGLYYAIYLFYYALCDRKNRKKYIIAYGIILLMMLMTFTRSHLLFISLNSIYIFWLYLKATKRMRANKRKILIAIAIILFFNGILGNLRHGYKWNDSHYISTLARIKNWPSFIPSQFQWSYIYIITPLGNLDYNIKKDNVNIYILGFIRELLPASIAKRIFPNKILNKELLIASYFNMSTCYCGPYLKMGFLGMFLYFIFIMFIGIIGTKLSTGKKNEKHRTVFASLLAIIYSLTFFENSYSDMAFGGVLLIVLLSMLLTYTTLGIKLRTCFHKT